LTLLFTGKISRGAARRDSGSRFCGGAVTAGRQKKIRFGRFNAHFELVWQQSNNAIVAGGGFVLGGIVTKGCHGDTLIWSITRRRYTQEQIADVVGIPRQTITDKIKNFAENGQMSEIGKTFTPLLYNKKAGSILNPASSLHSRLSSFS